MKIQFLRNGLFSLHPAFGPIVDCIEGGTFESDKPELLKDIIESGWAEEVNEGPDDSADTDPVIAPWDMEDWKPRAKDAKQRLQDYANALGLGLDLDLRSSIGTLINEIEAAR